jgi:hypothetical protein
VLASTIPPAQVLSLLRKAFARALSCHARPVAGSPAGQAGMVRRLISVEEGRSCLGAPNQAASSSVFGRNRFGRHAPEPMRCGKSGPSVTRRIGALTMAWLGERWIGERSS